MDWFPSYRLLVLYLLCNYWFIFIVINEIVSVHIQRSINPKDWSMLLSMKYRVM